MHFVGENPVLRGTMVTKGNPDENAKVPHIDDLSLLAKAGVSILHVCNSLDPWLDRETRVAEKKYKELGGNFTVIIKQGEGHFAVGPQDPQQERPARSTRQVPAAARGRT